MTVRIDNTRDATVGGLYVLAGGVITLAAAGYPRGTPAEMGPGFFPFWLGVVLVGLGLLVLVRSLLERGEKIPLESWDLRSLVWMVGATVVFAVALKPLGLALTVALQVVVSSLASADFSWRATLLNAAVLVALTVGGFVYGLSLPFPVWPQL